MTAQIEAELAALIDAQVAAKGWEKLKYARPIADAVDRLAAQGVGM